MGVIHFILIACIFAWFDFLRPVREYGKELWEKSVSPNGEHTLDIYRTAHGGATMGWVLKVEVEGENGPKEIYNNTLRYGAKQPDIRWIDDSVVSIEGTVLNLQKNERYYWKWENSITNSIFVKPVKYLFSLFVKDR